MPLPRVSAWVPTGSPALDRALGGGIPVGRTTEVFGAEGSGKSTFLEHLYVGVRHGLKGLVVDIDAEATRDEGKLQRLGLKAAEFVYCRPVHLAQILDVILELTRSLQGAKFPTIVGVDSLAAISTEEEQDGAMGAHAGNRAHARYVSEFFRKVPSLLHTANMALVFVNQAKSTVEGGRMVERTFAGKAVPFHATVRVRLVIIGQYKNAAGYVEGLKVLATMVKNKVDIPYRKVILPLYFDLGIDSTASVIATLAEHGLLMAEGNRVVLRTATKETRFYLHESQRYAAFKAKVAEDPALLDEAVALLWNPDAADIIRRVPEPVCAVEVGA